MIKNAICIYCGVEKQHPYEFCDSCNKCPRSKKDRMKSLYLSEFRFFNKPELKDWLNELDQLSVQLRNNESIKYNDEDLKKVEELENSLKDEPLSYFRLIKGIFIIFRPAIIFLSILWGILLIVKLILGM